MPFLSLRTRVNVLSKRDVRWTYGRHVIQGNINVLLCLFEHESTFCAGVTTVPLVTVTTQQATRSESHVAVVSIRSSRPRRQDTAGGTLGHCLQTSSSWRVGAIRVLLYLVLHGNTLNTRLTNTSKHYLLASSVSVAAAEFDISFTLCCSWPCSDGTVERLNAR